MLSGAKQLWIVAEAQHCRHKALSVGHTVLIRLFGGLLRLTPLPMGGVLPQSGMCPASTALAIIA